MHGSTVLFSYDARTRMMTKSENWSRLSGQNCLFVDTYLILDEGRVQMGVFQNDNGSLSVRFASVNQAPSGAT